MGSHTKIVQNEDGTETVLRRFLVYHRSGGMQKLDGISREDCLERANLKPQAISGVYAGYYCENKLNTTTFIPAGRAITLTNGKMVTTTASGASWYGPDDGWFIEYLDDADQYFYSKEYSDGIGVESMGWI